MNESLPQPALSGNALRTLEARYLRKDSSGSPAETPRELYWRVANTIASADARYGASPAQVRELAERFYGVMAQGTFLPNSPTLMNAGRSLGVLSACFVLPVGDSIEEIFESVKFAAQVQRAGGGTGFSFDRLRPTGDIISSSGGRTSGPISFWRVFAEATRAIQQGAFRRGANMGMMSVGHPDILKFVTAKNDWRQFENFNISVKIPDEFMRLLRLDGSCSHVVTNPRTAQSYLLPRALDIQRYSILDLRPLATSQDSAAPPPDEARKFYSRRDLWDMIVQGAWATGEPGVCFIDRVNADNPTPSVGRIEATNPCGEQPLLDFEACNLGSIDLSKFVKEGRLDEQALREMIRLGVHFLDNVIDANNYQVPQIQALCAANRKIGLGLMGLADAMFELGIRYDSDEGLAFARRIAALLTQEAFDASEQLARLRGTFPNFALSTWDAGPRGHHRPMRNAAVTTMAPTGTLSILAGCSGGIEPAYALAFFRHVLDGRELIEVNAPFERYARRKGFWSDALAMKLAHGARLRDLPEADAEAKELFVTAYDIAPADHVRMQAAFQECIDGAISKTINLPAAAQPGDVDAAYNLAYDLRCKGATVYRDGCRAGQPMTTQPAAAAAPPGPMTCPQCRTPLEDQPGCSRCLTCGATLCAM